MKILDVPNCDITLCGDWLKGDSAHKFRSGGYSHIRDNEGAIIAVERSGGVTDCELMLGEQVDPPKHSTF